MSLVQSKAEQERDGVQQQVLKYDNIGKNILFGYLFSVFCVNSQVECQFSLHVHSYEKTCFIDHHFGFDYSFPFDMVSIFVGDLCCVNFQCILLCILLVHINKFLAR